MKPFALAVTLALIAVRATAQSPATPEAESPPATLGNWYWGSPNHWSWHNMRRLFPTARVGRGDGPASPLPKAPLELGAIAFLDPVSSKQMTIQQMLDATDSDGFIVLYRGAVVYERYGHEMGPDDPHLLMSMTKSVTGALAGILVAQGRLGLQRPVTDYVPEMVGTMYEGATIRQLLDMVISDPSRDAAVRASDFKGIDTAAGWLPPSPGFSPGLRAWLQTLNRPKGENGRAFLYLTQSTTLAAWVMERATGKDFSRMLADEIWSKLGAEQDAYMVLDPFQQAYASPGLNITLRDMARFGLMIKNGGRANGQQIIPESWLSDIRHNGDPLAMARGRGTRSMFEMPMPGSEGESYRSFWWVSGPQCGQISANGLGGQLMIIDPEADVVAVKFTSSPDPVKGGTNTITAAYGIEAIIKSLSGHSCS